MDENNKIIEETDDYTIIFNEETNRWFLLYGDITHLVFNSLSNLRLVLAVMMKDKKEYGDYIFQQKDFDAFLKDSQA